MKKLMIAMLAAAQIGAAAQPAMAAELGDGSGAVSQRHGAFAGARLRIPLDGTRARKARAGLTVAPIVQGRQADGSVRTRFGEGMELRFAGGENPRLALGGRPISQLGQGRAGPDGRKAGISTVAWVAIGVGVTAVAILLLFDACRDGEICGSDRDD